MAYDKRVVSRVNDIFTARREGAFISLEKRKQEVYQMASEIEEIDRKLSMTTITMAREAVQRTLSPQRVEELKKNNLMLQSKRAEILVSLGLPFDYVTLKFHCKKCEDLGYIGSSMCSCYREELIKQAYHDSVLANAVPDASFLEFSLAYYSEAPDASGISPKDRMVNNVALCKNFAFHHHLQKKSLLLQGPTGLGKTFLSGCISKELVERGVDVVYETAHNIFATLERDKFATNEGVRADANRFFDCELLIIDDLGTEFITSFSVSAFYNLINTRLLKKKLMIINTNCEMGELEKLYSQRVASRLIGEFTLLKFCGEDIRFLKGRH